MNAQPLSNTPEVEGSRCHTHPDRPALGACTRCGIFYCEADRRVVGGQRYCEACAVRPGVDYLEDFRLKCWGRRDALAWLVGLGAVVNLVTGGITLANGEAGAGLLGVFLLLAGAVGVYFWLGMAWARTALIWVPICAIFLGLLRGYPELAGRSVFALLFFIAILNDTRNKLFFQMEVSPESLKKAWDLYNNNPLARVGVALGVLGFINPVIGLIALLCSTIALRRVDPDAQPPIGRRGQALAGIVLGGLSILGWGAFVLIMYLKS